MNIENIKKKITDALWFLLFLLIIGILIVLSTLYFLNKLGFRWGC